MKISGILTLFALLAGSAQATTVLFQDNFTPAAHPETSKWTTLVGPGSFLGRTQLANWVNRAIFRVDPCAEAQSLTRAGSTE